MGGVRGLVISGDRAVVATVSSCTMESLWTLSTNVAHVGKHDQSSATIHGDVDLDSALEAVVALLKSRTRSRIPGFQSC